MSLRPLLSAALITTASVLLLAPSAQAATPGSIQVTGNQLESALPPVSYFGHGSKLEGRFSSGNQVEHDPAITDPARMNCVAAWTMVGQAGYAETALAFEGVFATALAYNQNIYQFASSHAASAIFGAMHAKATSCRSYTLPPVKGAGSLHVSQSVSTMRVGGHQAFLITEISKFAKIPGAVNAYTLVTIDGSDLFAVQVPEAVGIKSPNKLKLSAVTLYMISKVSALR